MATGGANQGRKATMVSGMLYKMKALIKISIWKVKESQRMSLKKGIKHIMAQVTILTMILTIRSATESLSGKKIAGELAWF